MAKEVTNGFICVKCKQYTTFDFNICETCGWNHKNNKYIKKK